ncbi:MAG: hypothetical protein HQK54_17685 [Oligoflexales bacterium]|nr:hypothetical protein [Oligoflexales bacterium]
MNTSIKAIQTKYAISDFLGDLGGGAAGMLVALPSAIAFGLIVYSPFGAQFAGMGATMGILGTIALGLFVPLIGRTPKLVTAQCAPASRPGLF